MWPEIVREGRMMAFDDDAAKADGVPKGEMVECVQRVGNSRRDNVWLGTSVSNQATADKQIPALIACRDLAPVLFLSVEPILGEIDLAPYLADLDWVIVGGESGRDARPCDLDWVRCIVEQCKDVGVACFVKQLGANPVAFDDGGISGNESYVPYQCDNAKGSDPDEWPECLVVREVPRGGE